VIGQLAKANMDWGIWGKKIGGLAERRIGFRSQ